MFTPIRVIQTLIQYRSLIWNLAIKDIKVKYRSPKLGFLWAILIPLFLVFLFRFIFSTFLKIKIENFPFFIYLMTAIFPWTYFSSSVSGAVGSIADNKELIKKTYFPREILPVSMVLGNLINFIPALLVMFIILFLFKLQYTLFLFFVPLIVFLQTILTIGIALIVSSLQVILQDTKHLVGLMLTTLLYLSPTFYSLTTVVNFLGKRFGFYILNPFVGIFTFYRLVFMKGYAQALPKEVDIIGMVILTTLISIITFLIGSFVFKRYEPRFSDLI